MSQTEKEISENEKEWQAMLAELRERHGHFDFDRHAADFLKRYSRFAFQLDPQQERLVRWAYISGAQRMYNLLERAIKSGKQFNEIAELFSEFRAPIARKFTVPTDIIIVDGVSEDALNGQENVTAKNESPSVESS